MFDVEADYDSEIQEHDFGDLQGMLFMFSVSASQFLIYFLQDRLNWIVCLYHRNVVINSITGAGLPCNHIYSGGVAV